MKKESKPGGFWDREGCAYCGGAIREKTTELKRKIKGKHVLVENVPTGVCSECGTRYYSANVLKTIEETLSGRRKARREERVPVYSL
jgi:YgiT-type zinc finger domain-containing protein